MSDNENESQGGNNENEEPMNIDDNENSSRLRNRNRNENGDRARLRTILRPLDNELLNSRMISRTNEVLIDDLIGDSVYEMNLNRNYLDVQLVRIITPNRDQKAHIYSIRRKQNNNSSSEVNFTRIFQCRIFSEKNKSDHSRLIYLMEARNSNNVLLNRNLEYHDDGTITIGTFLRILAPQPIKNHMNGDIPLVKTPNPLVVLRRPDRLPHVSIH